MRQTYFVSLFIINPLLTLFYYFFFFKAFPEAEMKITLAGHSGMEKENIRELVAATEKFKSL